MENIGRRALYNLLRMNWLDDPTADVEPWQVEDYRTLETEELFSRLKDLKIHLTQEEFDEYVNSFDTPEDLAEALVEDENAKREDRVYLLIFELWRRLASHKPSLSIFCDELDLQILFYDLGEEDNLKDLQKALSNLQDILEDNIDDSQDEDPKDLFLSFSQGCANDVESFLYDFISDQIESNNTHYAAELVEGFSEYIQDTSWFKFLKANLSFQEDPVEANQILHAILSDPDHEPHMELLFDMLSLLVKNGDPFLFFEITKRIVKLIRMEEDFRDLLELASKFLLSLDRDQEDKVIRAIIKQRKKIDDSAPYSPNDSDTQTLMSILGTSLSLS